MSGIINSAGSRSGVIGTTELDYEEGTWTVAATMSTSGTVTMNTDYDTGGYTKVGRVVHVQANLSITSVSSPVGDLYFSLPFTTNNGLKTSDQGGIGIFTYSVDFTSGTSPCATWSNASSIFKLSASADNAANGSIVPAGGDWYTFSFSYHTV